MTSFGLSGKDSGVEHRGKPAGVFLDSSIHITRFESNAFDRKIHEALKEFPWKGTASYTKVEFGNVILSCAYYYYRKLEELGDLEKLCDFLYHRLRYNNKYRQWSYSILRETFNRDEATERAKLLLSTLMATGTAYISGYCDEVRDGIRCGWADQRVGPRIAWQRPNRPRNCRITEFFEENKPLFSQLRDTIEQMPEQQTRELEAFAKLIEQACKDVKVLKSCEKCRELADAIIAVESEGYKAFFTQNIRESDVLCRPLKQLLLYLQQDSDKPILRTDYRP